jgi:uncharacterized protein YkwD
LRTPPTSAHERVEVPLAPLWAVTLGALTAALAAEPQPEVALLREAQAPPPAPPAIEREAPAATPARRAAPLAATVVYSIGEPTDEEQLFVELINRARRDPVGEGVRLVTTTNPDVLGAYRQYGVDTNLLFAAFAALAPQPPLSISAALTTAARQHTEDMFANAFQGHSGSDGSTSDSRISATGYNWRTLRENVFSFATGVAYAHVGFEADWGAGPGGMQDPPGHRQAIHSGAVREIGVGVVRGTQTGANGLTVGPLLVTQDFGAEQTPRAFVTGVVYYDLNGDEFYDVGEGIGGVEVAVTGAEAIAVTAASGGYSAPVPGDGDYTVTFRVPGLGAVQRLATVSNTNNVKVDHLPLYEPPVLSGPASVLAGLEQRYQFSVVGAAQGYQWWQAQRVATNFVEGAEKGLAGLEVSATPGYSVVTSERKAAGAQAFHLAHPKPAGSGVPSAQSLTFRQLWRAGPEARLEFQSLLGWATPTQLARAQVSLDQGSSWQDVWTQAGTGGNGDPAFRSQSVSLARFAGAELALRFVYDFTGGSFFPQTDPGVGLYLDGVVLSGVEELVNSAVTDVTAGQSFGFTAAAAGNYVLAVRPKVSNRYLAWGPRTLLTANTLAPVASLALGGIRVDGQQAQIPFAVSYGPTNEFSVDGDRYFLEAASGLAEPWVLEAAAAFEVAGPGQFRFRTSAGGSGQRFFRVGAR